MHTNSVLSRVYVDPISKVAWCWRYVNNECNVNMSLSMIYFFGSDHINTRNS